MNPCLLYWQVISSLTTELRGSPAGETFKITEKEILSVSEAEFLKAAATTPKGEWPENEAATHAPESEHLEADPAWDW